MSSNTAPTSLKSFVLFKEAAKTINIQFPLSGIPDVEKKLIPSYIGPASRITASTVSIGSFTFGDDAGGIHSRPLNSKDSSQTV
jgi:hypothetical protein